MNKDVPEPFGPVYNIDSAGLTKWRRRARNGLQALSSLERQEYALAIEAAVKAKQRSEIMRATPSMPTPLCASRTWHSDGAAIHDAVRKQQRDSLLACPGKIRRDRSDETWREMYDEAMKEKRL